MTLKGHYALCFKTRASFGAHYDQDVDIFCRLSTMYERDRQPGNIDTNGRNRYSE